MQTIRDYRLGKRFPTKEDFSDDTEILWRKESHQGAVVYV